MKKILAAGMAAALLSGCAVTTETPDGKVETAALASGCAVSVSADGAYRVACATTDPAKLVHAMQQIKAAKNDD